MTRPARQTKLVCTIGPASAGRIGELIRRGMDVARINFSHGNDADRVAVVARVREEAEAAERAIGILADLPGPKVRLGRLHPAEIALEAGAPFLLRREGGTGDASGASTTHPGLIEDLRPGDVVFLADGFAELRVVSCEEHAVVTEVVRGGTVRSAAGVNVPAQRLSVPAVTDRDRRDLERASALGVDLVAQSFVRRAEDLRELRAVAGRIIHLVAKIETKAAVEDADRIMAEADALMIARGDLGVEIPFEEVPVVQKDLTRRAVAAGVPVIVATQMLESMTSSPRPTRAEASDVANAVLDGADAILLSAETAIGRHPVEAARAAAAICEVAERVAAQPPERTEVRGRTDAHAIARGAALLARERAVSAIGCFTRTGRTAALLSALRPGVPVVAFSPDRSVVRRLTLNRAIHPRECDLPGDTQQMIELMARRLGDEGLASAGGLVVMAASTRVGGAPVNVLTLHRIGGRPADAT